MGVFSKIKKTASGIAKNPTNLRNYADLGLQTATAGQVDTHGVNASAFGGKDISMDDLLLGKKAKDIQPDAITGDIRGAQTQGITAMSKGLNSLNSALDTPADQVINNQAEIAKKGILSSAQDARRNAQRVMAQQGLQGTSLGLASNRSIAQQAGERVSDVNAAIPGQIRNQSIQDAQTRINAGQSLFGGLGGTTGMNFNTIEGQRSGGVLGFASSMAPVAGTVAGYAMGGPAGGAIGAQAGQGMQQGFTKIQKPGNYSNYA